MTKCTHPDHAPAAGPRPPGLYIHRCPACGVRSSFVVRAPPSTALAVLAAMLLAGAACGRGVRARAGVPDGLDVEPRRHAAECAGVPEEGRRTVTCRRCGAPGTERMLVDQGEAIGGFVACDDCMVEADRELAVLHEHFDALIDGGFSNEQANAIMISRIEGTEVQ